MISREQCDETVLRRVHVLVLVDENVLKALLIFPTDLFVALEQIDRTNDQIVEVERVRLGKPPLVFRIDVGDTLADERRLVLRILLGPYQGVFRLVDLGKAGSRRKMPLVVIEIVENLFDELALVGVVDNGKAASDADA